ncbi:phosphoribosyl-AMP cyclohydrolase [Alcanivorax quisquiliarum]|uniref:Phosphoribosyl-AMP cyclohydrolase n=1 Tax=Alcanivorax quisquiliarum TaxID=2933565 RepID=A0ABT0E6H9_9GAMM|nr:phosphoribosyl-AMP cyclohydrolase [Alcanivorax quisquiliarum]MCK0537440.1 phosphoribosyl-AMP cyclohydrolase [Alcanivorax quisquiliarum]
MFKENEQQPNGFFLPLASALDTLGWNSDGLVPTIARQYDTGEVLMLAWMNRAALEETLRTGRVCYFSRSRGGLWRKGESSGQIQRLVELRIDCDGDALLLNVDQTGPACHTGRRDCFYWRADGEQLVLDKNPIIDPADLYPDKR